MTSNIHIDIQEWVLSYSDDMYRWALNKTNEQETAKDLVQETFLAAFSSFEKFKGNSQPKTWLFSILKNKIMDYHRKRFRESSVNQSQLNNRSDSKDILGDFFDNEGSWKPTSSPSNWHEIDGHLLDNIDFTDVLKDCMKELPENWSSAIHFKYLEDKDGKEICQELEITPSNYWQILHRAKLQLRMCIEKNWFKS